MEGGFSGCVVRGRRGCPGLRRRYAEYKNFELGVMFRSSPSGPRYRLLDDRCSRHGGEAPGATGADEDVILPLPYCVDDCLPYCDAHQRFVRAPFFNQAESAACNVRALLSQLRYSTD